MDSQVNWNVLLGVVFVVLAHFKTVERYISLLLRRLVCFYLSLSLSLPLTRSLTLSIFMGTEKQARVISSKSI